MGYKTLKLEKEGKIGILSINRPEALNAINSEVLSELDCMLEGIQRDPELHVLILTGEGRAFVAGADISEMSSLDATGGRAFASHGLRVFRKLELMEKPVIAAVNGFALGGGCELAMACDIRLASSKAKFGQPEVGLGITPGFAGTQRLPRLVGPATAKELIFTGKLIGADEALRIGLVNHIYEPEELLPAAKKLAEEIASKAQIAVRYSKTAINYGLETDVMTGMEMEKNLFGLCFATEDQKEGMAAFLEKRTPDYKTK